jgi:predicted transcriptional regulator
VGSAEREVLLALAHRHDGTWDTTCRPLYENSRSFTVELLERLVTRKFVTEQVKDDRTVYTLTRGGRTWADRNKPWGY